MKSTDWENPRIHGNPPLSVVVLHGGPGALGGMVRVASELANDWGILEPIQTAVSVTGQVEELRSVVDLVNGIGNGIAKGEFREIEPMIDDQYGIRCEARVGKQVECGAV
ncbi:MAG: hypothetical protein ACYC6N_11935 [Pirellulaceae bacterium]